MADTNSIGDAGENLAQLRLAKHGIFRVSFLGEKAPISDLLIEINDETTPFQALIQVKSTAQQNRYNPNGHILTPVPNDKFYKLQNRPIPTYVVGVDLVDEVIFIAPAYGGDGPYSSAIPPKIRIDNNKAQDIIALNTLKDDIIHYYQSHNIPQHKHQYQSLL